MKKTLMLALAPLTLMVGLEWRAPHDGGYVVLDHDAKPLTTAFNQDHGKVRLVMYVSPTCGGCLLGARDMQQKVLEKIDDANVAAYVIWAPKNGGHEEHVDRVIDLVTDARAKQYWDEYAAVAGPYDRMFDLAGPCAGVFALYGPDAKWDGETPPEPLLWQDAHADQRGREDNPKFDPDAMAKQIRALLS